MALGDIDLGFAWQTLHLATSTFVLHGRPCTYWHTQLCHTHTHSHLCHTPSFTHHLSHTHNICTLSFTQRSHSHTSLCHTQFCRTPSFTHNFVTHNFVTHHLCHTQLCHTHLSVTRNFVTHHLSHTLAQNSFFELLTWNVSFVQNKAEHLAKIGMAAAVCFLKWTEARQGNKTPNLIGFWLGRVPFRTKNAKKGHVKQTLNNR